MSIPQACLFCNIYMTLFVLLSPFRIAEIVPRSRLLRRSALDDQRRCFRSVAIIQDSELAREG